MYYFQGFLPPKLAKAKPIPPYTTKATPPGVKGLNLCNEYGSTNGMPSLLEVTPRYPIVPAARKL